MTRHPMRFMTLATPLLLAACADGTGDASSGAPTIAEEACLEAIVSTTRNADVELMGSRTVTGGTLVMVGVGPDRAPWQCLGNDDGSIADITSVSDEGAL